MICPRLCIDYIKKPIWENWNCGLECHMTKLEVDISSNSLDNYENSSSNWDIRLKRKQITASVSGKKRHKLHAVLNNICSH